MSAHLPQSAAPWQARFEEVRQRLLAHPIYDEVTSLERVRVFMEHHVFAVWDFMSLLKRLQQVVTCVHVPWMPPLHREMARFVNEIVLGEESDEDGRGGHASHFELTTPALSKLWEDELATMRLRIRAMRSALVERLRAAGVKRDLGFILRQQGMFSYSGLSAAQMQRLRSEFGVYGVDSGRICVAALNDGNLDAVARAIAAVDAQGAAA